MLIRYYCHAGIRTGFGKAAEGLARALLTIPGVKLEMRPLAPYGTLAFEGDGLPLASYVRTDDELDPNPDVVLVHTLPLDCRTVLVHAGFLAEMLIPGAWVRPRHARLIAYTTWEGSPPATGELIAALSDFDQVWVPSRHACIRSPAPDYLRSGITSHGNATTVFSEHVIPHAFNPASLAQRRPTEVLRDYPFRFYYIGAWTGRKNVRGLVLAFAHAFTKDDPVELFLHSPSASQENFLTAIHSTGMGTRLPRIRCNFEYKSDAAILGLHARSDCFVTATHGEAWNLPAFDAMLAGRHVIATGCCGHDEFLYDTSADIVPSSPTVASVDIHVVSISNGNGIEMRAVGPQGLDAQSNWREPNLEEMSQSMAHAFQNSTRTLNISYDPIERYGYEAVGALANRALQGVP